MAEPANDEEEILDYLINFRYDDKNARLLGHLRETVKLSALTNADESCMTFLRVIWSSAHKSQAFSDAQIDTEFVKEDGITVLTPVASIFRRGTRTLLNYLSEENPRVPTVPSMRLALRDLLKFLTADHTMFAEGSKAKEWQVAVRCAEHLLIPLVSKKSFKVDRYVGVDPKECCGIDHPPHGRKEDTSFGVPEGWHGRADIMVVGEDVPFSYFAQDGEEDDGSPVSSHSTEDFKKGDNFKSRTLQQIMAQTIVFSFLKHKMDKNLLSGILVPVIGMCAEKIIVYMYDCVGDFLLEGQVLELFTEDHGFGILNLRAVFNLWLVLHYQIFCTDIPECRKKEIYKSGFMKLLGERLYELYKTNVTQPCNVTLSERKERMPYIRGGCCTNLNDNLLEENEPHLYRSINK